MIEALTAAVFGGLMLTWLDRKISARLQYRQGPPWFQPFADIAKLLGKETVIPENGSKWVFLFAPLLGLSAALLSAVMILVPASGFSGDIIVIIYLLAMPSLSIILAGSASANPLSALGSSREMKLVLAYELPFIITVVTSMIKPNIFAFAAALLVVQAKLGFVPFDVAEAEQEIMGGPLLEYSGPPLAIFRLTKAILFFILPAFLVKVFWGGAVFSIWFALKYILVFTLIVLIKNTNPRLRIDQAIRFFWGPVTITALLGLFLAVLGR